MQKGGKLQQAPASEPSRCELSKREPVLTRPVVQVSPDVWLTLSLVCPLYK